MSGIRATMNIKQGQYFKTSTCEQQLLVLACDSQLFFATFVQERKSRQQTGHFLVACERKLVGCAARTKSSATIRCEKKIARCFVRPSRAQGRMVQESQSTDSKRTTLLARQGRAPPLQKVRIVLQHIPRVHLWFWRKRCSARRRPWRCDCHSLNGPLGVRLHILLDHSPHVYFVNPYPGPLIS